MDQTMRFPGPWAVRAEQPWGFEVTRAIGGHTSEWLSDEKGEPLVFNTAIEAEAAIVAIGGHNG